MSGRLIVTKNTAKNPQVCPGDSVVTFQEFRSWFAGRQLAHKLLRYREAHLSTYAIPVLGRLLPTAIAMRAVTRGPVWFSDEWGSSQRIGIGTIARFALAAVRDYLSGQRLQKDTHRAVELVSGIKRPACVNKSGQPLYLRTDFAFGLTGGGSVGHIAGVLNRLDEFCAKPILMSSDRIPTTRDDLEAHIVWPTARFRDFGELWSAAFNEHFLEQAYRVLGDRDVSLVYQRYSHNNYCGLQISAERSVPFVLEYNGSEVWMARNWGTPLKYEALAEKIELANLNGADLVVVVSAAMRDELVGRGIPADKILVNPNGVDPDMYRPDLDGTAVREQHGLLGKAVVGFIGTFGRWHGAEVLAEAFGRLLERRPDLRDVARLLMVGDGVTMPEVRAAVEAHGIAEQVVMTGLVPQDQGPAHLAAMDVLASPHVPNPDGTPFFGSPTKLFEYMAMGRGIVASDLDQIGEVLRHDVTAWMVEPGDVDSLVSGLERLIDDESLRRRLGAAARIEAVERYSWREHTRRIVEALEERCR